MRFALSTNWCCRRLETGEAVVDEALALGFEALELGFHTTEAQVGGFRTRLGEMPVGSVHAFCPVPLSAPCGHPELYRLADFDETARALARVHVRRNVEFAADMGADALVLHAGHAPCRTLFRRSRLKRRRRAGRALADVFRRELDLLVPALERNRVTLGLENLPYLEGFPDEDEVRAVAGDWVRPWLDTGHAFVRQRNGWATPEAAFFLDSPSAPASSASRPVGLHLNDSRGGDDHLPPGEGLVDFAALEPLARAARHLVLEPHADVTGDALRRGLEFLRAKWEAAVSPPLFPPQKVI